MVTIKCQHSGLEFEAETRRTKQHPRIAAAKQQAHKDGLSREMEAALDSVQRSGEYTTIDEYMEQVTAIMRGEEQSAKEQKNARNRAQAERKAAREEALAKREATNRLLKQHGYTWHVDVVDAQDISDAMDTRNTDKTFFLTSPNGEVVSVEQALSAIEQETNSAEKTEVVRVDNALSTEQQTVLTKSVEHNGYETEVVVSFDFYDYDDKTENEIYRWRVAPYAYTPDNMGGEMDAPDWEGWFDTQVEAIAFANNVFAEILEGVEAQMQEEREEI